MSDTLSFAPTLPDEVAILLHDENGAVRRSAYPDQCLGAAQIAELWLRDRLAVRGGRIEVASFDESGDELLDAELSALMGHGEPVTVANRLVAYRGLLDPYQERLVRAGVLRSQSKGFWILKGQRYVPDPQLSGDIRERLADAARTQLPDDRMAVTAGILTGSGLGRALFDVNPEPIALAQLAHSTTIGIAITTGLVDAIAILTATTR